MSSTLTLNETHCLFVKKASTASVLIRAFDCNPLLEEDVIVGSGVVPFREFHVSTHSMCVNRTFSYFLDSG